MSTKISDNEEEDKFKNKLIGVVNYGLLEKEASTLLDSRCLENVFPAVLNRESIFVALPFVYLFSSHRLPKPKKHNSEENLWFQPGRCSFRFFVFVGLCEWKCSNTYSATCTYICTICTLAQGSSD